MISIFSTSSSFSKEYNTHTYACKVHIVWSLRSVLSQKLFQVGNWFVVVAVSFNYINNVVICWCITIICPSLFLIKYLLVCVFLADGLLSCSNVTCFFDIIVFYISTNIVARNAFKNVTFNRVQLISSNRFDRFRNLITKSGFPNSSLHLPPHPPPHPNFDVPSFHHHDCF